MAYWGNTLKYTVKPGTPIKLGEGENTFLTPFEIKQSESSFSRNVSNRNYPALSVRPGMVNAFASIVSPNAFGVYNNTLPHVQDGTIWKRWDGAAWQNVQTGLTAAAGKFLEFSTEAAGYIVLVNGTNKYAWNGSVVTDLIAAPATRLYAVDDYRLYALIGKVLKCSAEGSITDWTTALNADSITIADMIGQGTAIAAYMDTVICWSEISMHMLLGNDPYDFQFSQPMEYGCVSDRSVIEHDGRLYFLDKDAYKVYSGGKPQKISDKVKTYIEGINQTYKSLCAAGKHGKYIYLSIPYLSATTNNLTLEYDTELDLWYPMDTGYSQFINIGSDFYGITPGGQPIKINYGTNNNGTAISWSYITGAWNKGAIALKKVISDMWMVVDLPVGSTMTVSYSTSVDSDDFNLLYTFTASATEQMTRIKIPTTALQNINWYRLKFAGTGPCTVHYLQEDYRIKER